ncbi:hypothetical protein ACAX43_31640 [Paraburkholderia sp. IW21]
MGRNPATGAEMHTRR